VDSFVDVESQLFLSLDGRCERPLPPFQLFSSLLRSELVVDDFEDTRGLDGTICRGAVRAVDDFACHGVYGFEEGLALNVFEVWFAEALEISTAIGFFKEDMCAALERVRKYFHARDSHHAPCISTAESQ